MDYGNGKTQTAMGGSLSGGPVSERPTPMMDIAMKTLSERIERLDRVVEQAANRFAPVVRQEPPSATGAQTDVMKRVGASSQLGSAVELFTQQIDTATNRLSSLIDRCEL